MCINTTGTISPYSPLKTNQDVLAKILAGQVEEYCNACVCENGTALCTNLWCGLTNCFRPETNGKNGSKSSGSCPQHEVCVPSLNENCLKEPCSLRGDCRILEPSHRVAPPRFPSLSNCWPNQAVLNENCARLTILMDRSRLNPGSSVEGLCSVLRFLLASRLITEPTIDSTNPSDQHENGMIIIICDLKAGTNDSIEVTVVSYK